MKKHPGKKAKSELGVQERTCCKPEQNPCCEHAGEACSIQLLSWRSGEIMLSDASSSNQAGDYTLTLLSSCWSKISLLTSLGFQHSHLYLKCNASSLGNA